MTRESRTRLWLTSPHFYPTYGGAQSRYRRYIPGLLARGLDVQILTGTPQLDERSESDAGAEWYREEPGTWLPRAELDGAPLERVRLPDHKGRIRTQIYYDSLLEVCGRPAAGPVVVQLITNIRPAARTWIRNLKSRGVATIYSVSQFPTWPQKPVKRLFRRRGYQQIYNELDALVTNSTALREFLREIGVSTRIEYIPNGVDRDRFHPARDAMEALCRERLRAGLGIPGDATVIAAVGAVMPRKGPDLVLRSWRRLVEDYPDTHVLFIGPRADLHDPKLKDFAGTLRELIDQSQRPEQVHFAGNVDNVEDYLRAADVFVLASRREGTPNSLLEAMAVGLPAVTTEFVGISDSIGSAGDQFLLADRSVESVSASLGRLLDQRGLREALCKAGQAHVAARHDLNATLDRYARVYRELGDMASLRRAG